MHGLNLYDNLARLYDPVYGNFTGLDRLSEDYYGISPYAHCANNPIRNVDPDGKAPRIYVETKGFGHAFITTGLGKATTVYTYGRYGYIDAKKSSGSSSGSLAPIGEGVLLVKKGSEALEYIETEVKDKGALIYEVKNGSDEKVDKHFNDMFNSSDQKPSRGKFQDSDNAKVVDKYDLLNNNCTTKTSEAVKIATDGKLDLKSSAPINLDTKLYYMNQEKNSEIQSIYLKTIYDEYNQK